MLHRHAGCTNYTHDLLDLIEDGMLLIGPLPSEHEQTSTERLAQTPAVTRITSEKLVEELQRMDLRAKKDPRYLSEPCEEYRQNKPIKEPLGVAAIVDETIRSFIAEDTMASLSKRSFHPSQRPTRSYRYREDRSIRRPEFSLSVSSQIGPTSIPDAVNLNQEPKTAGTNTKRLDLFEEIASIIVRDTDKADVSTQKVTFEAAWELRQCLRDELDGGDLGQYLTITGDSSSNFWAASCRDYVSFMWNRTGLEILTDLETTLRENLTTQETIG